MSDNTDHKNNGGLLRRISRRLIAGFIIVALVGTASLSFAPDAYAKKKFPNLSAGIAGIFFLEVMDFDPHFGQEPIPYWLTIPVQPIPPYGLPSIRFKTWCGPPIYVFGWCLPFPFHSWCNSFPKCMASNAVNLVSTLLIKHATPSTEGRLKQVIPAASLPDYYSRDACVNSSKLDFEAFDNKTGDLKANDASKYGDSALGLLAGAKPFINACASTINTPKFDPPIDPGKSFAFYQNANNDNFKALSGKDEDINKLIYKNSNGYLATTFPIEGALGCPKKIFDNDPELKDKPSTPELWKKKMEKCYDYYILSRATHPEWTLERPGIGTDDPMTYDAPKGNPELAIFDSCQPLMSGEDSRDFTLGVKSPAVPGALKFAPVLQYNRADLDEADYDVGKELERSYKKSFPTGIDGEAMPVFQNIFPCVTKPTDGGPAKKTHWAMFNAILIVNYLISALVERTVIEKSKNWGPQMFFPFLSPAMPEDIDYTSVGAGKAGFCPNVEKINVPTNPFAPRDNFKSKGETLADKALYYLFLRASPYIYNATLGLEPKATEYSTDRDYSYQTSFYTPSARVLQEKPKDIKIGYSKYTDNFQDGTFKPDPDKLLEHLVHPEVMCAIVPVDILESRRKAFDSCIMQRIDYNFITWRRRNFLRFYYKYTLKKWKKPCATRFYESDNIKKCPMSMSIQQCCRIIVKDVVPMNYVKIRTCEGLRQKRNLIFGIDHIYDSAATTATTVEYQIGLAQDALDRAEQQWEVDLGSVIAGNTALLTAYSTASEAMGDANDGDDTAAIAAAQANLNAVYNNIITTTGSAKLKADMDAILAAQANLAAAQDTPVTVVPVSSPNGLYFTVSDPASYETALALNQKLALLGCDNTEPDDYRFSHYFHLSTWGDFGDHIPSKFISDGIGLLQKGSDDVILAARKEANRLANATAATAWATLEVARANSELIIADAKKVELRAIENSQNAWDECKNAEIRLMGLKDLKTALMTDPSGFTDAGVAYGVKCANARAMAALAVVASKTFNTVKDIQDKILRDVQGGVRNTIQMAQDKAETDFIINGKQTADRLIIEGMAELETAVQSKFPAAINAVYNRAMSDKTMKIGMMILGEGGAHMPYMRWWDTGTSAGNPTRGGSFINTLGSYDTIIGVGHEERDFYDAGGTSSATGFSKLFDGLSSITSGLDITKFMTLKGLTGGFNKFTGSVTKSFKDFSVFVKDIGSGSLFDTSKIKDALKTGTDGIGKAITAAKGDLTGSALASIDDFKTKVEAVGTAVTSSMTAVPTSVASSVTELTTALGDAGTNFSTAMGKVPGMINDPIKNLATTDPASAFTTFTGTTAITPAATALGGKVSTDISSATNPTSTLLNDVCGITYKKKPTTNCAARLTSALGTFATPGGAGVPDMATMTANAAGVAVTNNTANLDSIYTSINNIAKTPLPVLPSIGSFAPDGVAGTLLTSIVGSSFVASVDSFISGVITSATSTVTSFVSSLTGPLTTGITALKAAGTSLSSTIAGIAVGSLSPASITDAVNAANAKASVLVSTATSSLSMTTAALNSATIAYNANPTNSTVAAAYVSAKTDFDISTAVLKEANALAADISAAGADATDIVNRKTLADAAVAAAAAMPTSTPDEIAAQLDAMNAAQAELVGAKTALDAEAAYIQDVFDKKTDYAQKEVDAMVGGVPGNVDNTVRGIISAATGANSPSQSLTERAKMGRIGGWGGLKGHQMWTTRRSNLVCIGRYEKLFKQGEAENFVLSRAGANYTSKAGAQWSWPLQWRGYINDPNNEFEKNLLPGRGLDLAQKGDIIIYRAAGLKRIAYVTDVNQYEPYFVRVESWDQGKFPTVSGAGVAWGNKVERTIYKTEVPISEQSLKIGASLTAISGLSPSVVAKTGLVNPSCEDPGFKSCVLGGDNVYKIDDGTEVHNDTWDDVKIYRPSLDTDTRQCPFLYTKDGNIQTDDKDTDTFSYCLNAGYDPPPQYVSNYRGVGTGSISDLSLCSAKWTGCTTVVKADDVKCFPGAVPPNGDVCTVAAGAPVVPPPPPPVCTPAQYDAAKAAYDAEYAAKQAALDKAEADSDALDAVEAAALYNALETKVNGRLTEGSQASAVMASNLVPVPAYVKWCVSWAPVVCCSFGKMGCMGSCGGGCIAYKDNSDDIAAAKAHNAPYESAMASLAAAAANLTAANDYLIDVYTRLKNFEADHASEIALYEAYVASLDTDTPMTIDPSVIAAAEEYETLSAAIDPALASVNSAISAMESALATAYALGASPDPVVEASIAAADAAAATAAANADAGEDVVAAAQADLMNIPPFKCPWP